MAQNYGLGRGLASLIPKKSVPQPASAAAADVNKKKEPEKKSIQEVGIDLIVPNPHQPRLTFNEEKLEELSNSIKHHGIIQPLVVSQKGNGFELIAGERRYQAAQKAGLEKVPVIVRDAQDKEKLELALAENIQRHDLNPVEEAKAYKKLADDFEMSQEEIADRVGKGRSAIANKMRLLSLPVEIQKALIEGRVTEGHAKAILAVTNQEKQRALFKLIVKQNLTVRQTEDKTKEISVRSHKRVVNVDPEIKDLENKLIGMLGTKVKVTKSGGGGKIIIEYYSGEELENIIHKISN